MGPVLSSPLKFSEKRNTLLTRYLIHEHKEHSRVLLRLYSKPTYVVIYVRLYKALDSQVVGL